MEEKMKKIKYEDAKDTRVTALSLVVITVQSLIIIFGMYYRWDWLAYECAAMLIIPGLIVLYYGLKAIVQANTLMVQERKIDEYKGNSGEGE